MAQFDVYPNPGRNREQIPFVLDLQANLLGELSTRVVAPLGVPEIVDRRYLPVLHPILRINRRNVVLMTTELAHLPARLLVKPVTNVESHRLDIVRAIDAVFSGI